MKQANDVGAVHAQGHSGVLHVDSSWLARCGWAALDIIPDTGTLGFSSCSWCKKDVMVDKHAVQDLPTVRGLQSSNSVRKPDESSTAQAQGSMPTSLLAIPDHRCSMCDDCGTVSFSACSWCCASRD